MNSSSEILQDTARTSDASRDPGFTAVVAFDFYDGPENGLAVYPSGAAIRFASLGDSTSRSFRAFELVSIEGDWRSRVASLGAANGNAPKDRVLVLPASDLLEKLVVDVRDAPTTGYFVGVGNPYLDHLRVAAINLELLNALRRLDGSPAAYRCAHSIVKGKVDFSMAAE